MVLLDSAPADAALRLSRTSLRNSRTQTYKRLSTGNGAMRTCSNFRLYDSKFDRNPAQMASE
jgi:hypothetical protein